MKSKNINTEIDCILSKADKKEKNLICMIVYLLEEIGLDYISNPKDALNYMKEVKKLIQKIENN